MQYFAILLKLIPFLVSMVKSAEVAFKDEEKSGAKKKKAVTEGFTAMFDGAAEVSTGGQKETFTALKPLFDSVIDKGIDLIVTLLF